MRFCLKIKPNYTKNKLILAFPILGLCTPCIFSAFAELGYYFCKDTNFTELFLIIRALTMYSEVAKNSLIKALDSSISCALKHIC